VQHSSNGIDGDAERLVKAVWNDADIHAPAVQVAGEVDGGIGQLPEAEIKPTADAYLPFGSEIKVATEDE
jgi:hypothetical protein